MISQFKFKRLDTKTQNVISHDRTYEVEEMRNLRDIRRRVNEARYFDICEERKTAGGALLHGRGAIFYVWSVTGT